VSLFYFLHSNFFFLLNFFSFSFSILLLILDTIFCVCGYYRADPFTKKDWYDIKAPSLFNVKNVGKTLVTRTQGTKVCFFTLFFVLFCFIFFVFLILSSVWSTRNCWIRNQVKFCIWFFLYCFHFYFVVSFLCS
jgi:hypothetical protein